MIMNATDVGRHRKVKMSGPLANEKRLLCLHRIDLALPFLFHPLWPDFYTFLFFSFFFCLKLFLTTRHSSPDSFFMWCSLYEARKVPLFSKSFFKSRYFFFSLERDENLFANEWLFKSTSAFTSGSTLRLTLVPPSRWIPEDALTVRPSVDHVVNNRGYEAEEKR